MVDITGIFLTVFYTNNLNIAAFSGKKKVVWNTNEETIYQNISLPLRIEKTHQTMVAVPVDRYDMVLVKPAPPAF